MSTPIENFRKGDYFVVYLCNGEYQGKRGDPCVSGEPLKFLAMGLPFIAIQIMDGTTAALDTRIYSIRKVSRDYVRALTKKKVKRKPKQAIAPQTCCGKTVTEPKWIPIDTGRLNSSIEDTTGIEDTSGFES